ncbi:transcription elongation factor GreA [Lutibacter oricola]|uniref:Transcription elongation factor GreA n=1 Tax=Lutibacter oricola TaxID=762486 RepID=A0A1H3EFV7_9FLAO|nr:transcription elongation factor GreA [Lutibacter oricola]SDX77108.1 transcription elongation factor GreA [Lutibacter oricola]
MSNVSYYSEEGMKKLKDELDHLENVERPRVSNEIAEARDKGDLSENAEYHAAKEEQSLLELKIAKLKGVVSNARIIDESLLDTSKVLIHSIVKIKNVANGMEFSYTLVADSETNIKEGKLSVNSPIGKGLLGKEVGDVAEIKVPAGVMKFEIVEISRA